MAQSGQSGQPSQPGKRQPGAGAVSAALAGLLADEERQIVANWIALLRQTLPALFSSLDPAAWATRVIDVLNVLQAELADPDELRYPVLGAREEAEPLLALGRRAVEVSGREKLELHEFHSAYALLELALSDALRAARPAAFTEPEQRLITNFFHQLTAAIGLAITAQRTAGLEAEVADRTAHLQAQVVKEYELTAFLSHNVRTLLTTILGVCDVLLDIHVEPLSETQRRYVGLVLQSGELILGLVNDLQDYARLDVGKEHLQFEPVDLRQVAQAAIKELEPLWRPKELAVALEFPADLPPVSGDHERLRQIVVNLVANAIRFSPMRGRVALRASRTDDHVDLEVLTPSAVLLAPERARILARIRELEGQMQPGIGAGLGLPLVKLLTDLQGGKLEVLSHPQEGQLVKMSLPMAA